MEHVLSCGRHIKCSKNIEFKHPIFIVSIPFPKRYHRAVCSACKLISATADQLLNMITLREDNIHVYVCVVCTCESV